jgi:hypothetical protein
MADVSIKYKDNVIVEMNESESKTLNTSGCYCEGNIVVDYTPSNKGGNSKTYEITLPKASGKILLLELEGDVLEHIDDSGLTVTLINVSEYSFEKYSVAFVTISNTVFALQGDVQMYGMALRQGSETGTTLGRVSCPANNEVEDIAGSNIGWFILDRDNKKYYVKPADGFIRSGTYRLTFAW